MGKKQIRVCQGTGCLSSKSDEITQILKDGISDGTEVKISGCHGFCSQGPIVLVDDVLYTHTSKSDVKFIIKNHIGEGKILKNKLYKNPETNRRIEKYKDIPFYANQHRILLERCGVIDPESIDDYIAHRGYEGLKRAIDIGPENIIEIVKEAGLRGRGGAGFPTGLKWEFARKAKGTQKYVIINADEGDPGAFMDRSILEADPHSVIEGMMISAIAIAASVGYIYVRAEYPLAVKRFKIAVEQARERGFLGSNILGSRFSFEIVVNEGAGAFVCGEETALIASIEGKRGIPRQKPPFPAVSGLFNAPTNINNVKTFAAVAWILRHGADKFKQMGTWESPGTAIFSLTGKVKNSGLIEVEMGTTLREIIFDIGGGVSKNRKFKAVQTGGPSGGCIPEQYLDTPVDYSSLAELGSIMGSGGMVVIDEDTCIVEFAKYFLGFTQEESCGKCTPCREGTLRALEILERITRGEGRMSDIDDLENLARVIKTTSLCGLGQTAPNPLLSTLKYFRDEYIEHIVEGTCRAGVCKGMFSLEINHEKCISCSKCQKGCAFDSILGNREEGFVIQTETCEGCRACLEACPVNGIEVKPPILQKVK